MLEFFQDFLVFNQNAFLSIYQFFVALLSSSGIKVIGPVTSLAHQDLPRARGGWRHEGRKPDSCMN